MIQRSFFQFQKDKDALDTQEKRRDLEAQLAGIEDLRSVVKDDVKYSFSVDEAIADYYYLTKELERRGEEKRQVIIKPENVAPFLNPGRLVAMKDGAVDWGWGVLVSAIRQKIT